jgi:hypothetical protein
MLLLIDLPSNCAARKTRCKVAPDKSGSSRARRWPGFAANEFIFKKLSSIRANWSKAFLSKTTGTVLKNYIF